MNRITALAILSTASCVVVNAAPFMAVGDNAELFLTAKAEVQADSNIYLDTTKEQNDTIYSFTPGVDLVFGKGSVTKGNVYYREEIRRYADNDVQDTELSSVGANSAYNNGVTKVDLNASYDQIAQNDNDLRATGLIVRREVTNLGAEAEFGVTEKTVIGVGLSFDKTDYGPASYVDSDIWMLPVDVYYKATPKLDWSLGYRYRSTDLSGSASDSNDNFFNLGARGEFTPKLTGQVRVGYNQRSLDRGADEDQLGFEGNLSYAYSDKTSLVFNLGNDFGSSGSGESTKDFNIGLTGSNKFNEQWTLNTGLTYRKSEYPTRTDDFIEATAGVAYVYSNYVNFAAAFTLRDNGSDLASAEFAQNVFSLSANVRY
jgi:polysaccharide biosynthesis protein VpsM